MMSKFKSANSTITVVHVVDMIMEEEINNVLGRTNGIRKCLRMNSRP